MKASKYGEARSGHVNFEQERRSYHFGGYLESLLDEPEQARYES